MSPEDFRRFGREVVDWIAAYLSSVEDYPVLAKVEPGELVRVLPRSAPERGEPMRQILEDFERCVLPGITHWNHPGFMGYFSVSATPPGILAEMLAAALNVNGMLWKTSPAATELEQVTLDWLRQWIGLAPDFFGIIHDTASTSTMHAIASAREMASPERLDRLVLYTSEQAHSSVEKGAIAVGMAREHIRKIPVDEQYRMRAEALAETVETDTAAGLKPFCVVATVGTTSTTSVDPVPEIAEIAAQNGLWLHVDAAYAGSAAILPEFRHLLAGAERAHSIVLNPHKWLGTPIDLSAFYTRFPEILRRAFSLVPEYLSGAGDQPVCNYMEYGVPLGRRFRSLKLWFVMRYYGREGIAATIRSHICWARELGTAIAADPRFELMAPVVLSVVCFRCKGDDEDNRRLLERINASGEVFLSSTVLKGKFTLRLAIGNFATTRKHVDRAWAIVQDSLGSVKRNFV